LKNNEAEWVKLRMLLNKARLEMSDKIDKGEVPLFGFPPVLLIEDTNRIIIIPAKKKDQSKKEDCDKEAKGNDPMVSLVGELPVSGVQKNRSTEQLEEGQKIDRFAFMNIITETIVGGEKNKKTEVREVINASKLEHRREAEL
jgi:hypothetical protein